MSNANFVMFIDYVKLTLQTLIEHRITTFVKLDLPRNSTRHSNVSNQRFDRKKAFESI